MRKVMAALLCSTALMVSCLKVSCPASADAIGDFYGGPGKQMRIIIRTTVGGDYDILSRVIARHLSKHIPGHPVITPVNMPAAGGIAAANYMANVAPRDGTVLSIVGQGLPVDQALGLSPQFKSDLREFNWIANVVSSNSVLVTWHTSPTKTLADAKERETTIGTTGAGSVSVQFPAFYNNVLGTKFKIVFGYPGGAQIDLAMERGEVEGRGSNTYHGYMTSKPDYTAKKLITPIIQIGLKPEPGLGKTPLLLDQPVPAHDRPLLEFMSRGVAMGRPLATTPGVPAERVAALRAAYRAMLKDPEFIAEADKLKIDVGTMTGEELTQLVRDLVGVSPEIGERTKLAIQPKSSDTQEIKLDKKK
jgi:tripartite-type tricarboxylate transporter receptor subunit TctC